MSVLKEATFHFISFTSLPFNCHISAVIITVNDSMSEILLWSADGGSSASSCILASCSVSAESTTQQPNSLWPQVCTCYLSPCYDFQTMMLMVIWWFRSDGSGDDSGDFASVFSLSSVELNLIWFFSQLPNKQMSLWKYSKTYTCLFFQTSLMEYFKEVL